MSFDSWSMLEATFPGSRTGSEYPKSSRSSGAPIGEGDLGLPPPPRPPLPPPRASAVEAPSRTRKLE